MRDKIHNFFENPKGFWAWMVQGIIFILIIVSVGLVILELLYPHIFQEKKELFELINYVILGVFTVEYLLRISTASQKLIWAQKPLNFIDFLAVFPNYLEFVLEAFFQTTPLRAIRLLRFFRMLRLLKLFRYAKILKRVLRFQKTILQAITPIITLFVVIKIVIWGLETYDLWFQDKNLGELFAIIGFALGIILSQKIGVSYDKFIQVEEAVVRLSSNLHSLSFILQKKEAETFCKNWAKTFLRLLEDPKSRNQDIYKANEKLYKIISEIEPTPAELAVMQSDICRDAAFCLSKKVRLTPKAYDTLLHQATLLYLLLITLFIPGMTGIISILIATYILYGMYNLTQDFDSILGGEFNLINIDISEFEDYAKNN